MPDIATRRRFLLFLVKPSHYDDEGYIIQWWKSALPSNSLACLFGIAQKCMEDQVLGEVTPPHGCGEVVMDTLGALGGDDGCHR